MSSSKMAHSLTGQPNWYSAGAASQGPLGWQDSQVPFHTASPCGQSGLPHSKVVQGNQIFKNILANFLQSAKAEAARPF